MLRGGAFIIKICGDFPITGYVQAQVERRLMKETLSCTKQWIEPEVLKGSIPLSDSTMLYTLQF